MNLIFNIAAALIISAMTIPTTQAKSKKPSSKRPSVQKASVKKVKKSETSETAKLSTDHNFNDSVLHGRYQTPHEADVKVENEKVLADLLAVRRNFKDRLKKSSEQN